MTETLPWGTTMAGMIYLGMVVWGVGLAARFWIYLRRNPTPPISTCWTWHDLGMVAAISLTILVLSAGLTVGLTPAASILPGAFRILLMHAAGLALAMRLWRAHNCPTGRRQWMTDIRRGLLFYLAALPFILFAGVLNHLLMRIMGHDPALQDAAQMLLGHPDWRARALLIVAAVGSAPVYEELLFRSMALPLLARRMGLWPAIGINAAIFAAIHLHIFTMLPLFVLAVFLSFAYIYSRSLLTCITMHALFNIINIIMLLNMPGPAG